MPRALVREVPSSFAAALCATPPDPPIDVARARAQHAAYARALGQLGLEVVTVAADEGHPDCCFIEDTAVVAGGVALLSRPGAPSRRGEIDAVARALAPHLELHRTEAPAAFDGGDVLRLGRALYVGLSSRTNAAGAARIAEVFGRLGFRVAPMPTPARGLHLKSVCSALADDLVLAVEGALDPAGFPGARLLAVPAAEAHAANAVAWGGAALVAAGAPRTRERVDAAGIRSISVDTSELRKADGALTCLSIIVA